MDIKIQIAVCCLLIALNVNISIAQDIEPQYPVDFPGTTTNRLTTGAPITVTPITETTTTSTTTPATTTTISTTPTTRPTSISSTTSTPTTTTIAAPTTTSSIAPPPTSTTTTLTPTYHPHPGYPDYWNRRCYYKEQRGSGSLKWVCGQLRWVHSVDCFHCCFYEYSSFAGCYKVHSGYCHYHRK